MSGIWTLTLPLLSWTSVIRLTTFTGMLFSKLSRNPFLRHSLTHIPSMLIPPTSSSGIHDRICSGLTARRSPRPLPAVLSINQALAVQQWIWITYWILTCRWHHTKFKDVAGEVLLLQEAASNLELTLNANKCEIITSAPWVFYYSQQLLAFQVLFFSAHRFFRVML